LKPQIEHTFDQMIQRDEEIAKAKVARKAQTPGQLAAL
jgi:hypothetical protein